MKIVVLSFLLSCSLFPLFAQEDTKTNGIFYKISLATTLTINKDYTLDQDDESGPLINPSAFFINNTLGYQFDARSLISVNLEYDYHSDQGLHFLPIYLGFQYNIFDFDDKIFIRGGYGRFLNLGKDFEKGTLYKAGIGIQIYDENFKNSTLFGFDFTRKRFGHKQEEKLSSISVFLEFMIF